MGMRTTRLATIAKQVAISVLKTRSARRLIGLMCILSAFSVCTGYRQTAHHKQVSTEYRHEVRKNWENNPDKHPHRMAHYGYIAFRAKHPLSFFDSGIESYTGNAVFLEAHRQNTVNFSEASLSTGMLRFGEISAAMVLQVLLPLMIFFWGFGLIAAERENGILKMTLSQGVSRSELLAGKTLGLLAVSCPVYLAAAVAGLLLVLRLAPFETTEVYSRFAWMMLIYAVYMLICCLLAVLVSARSTSSKSALIHLIGFWLLFTLVLPRFSQELSRGLHPAPSKVVFEAAVEAELIQQGDSHNPDDPHYKALKDSLLKTYNVDSVQQLPFNYSGYVMKEGEKISTQIYLKHQRSLLDIYQKQQDVVRSIALINPFMALKNLSMALAGTDFAAYIDFQAQTEAYRYRLAQQMNDWQIQMIGNKKLGEKDRPYFIGREYWKQFPDFEYRFLSLATVLRNEQLALTTLLIWLAGLLVLGRVGGSNMKNL
jgi:ABC-2 type transport system permease protein